MRSLFAFTKKEITEQIRSGRLMILIILFVAFGIMNPAVAKMTPWLIEILSDSVEQSGIIIAVTTVTALDSWTQFFKNIPMAFIAFVLMQSNIFTKEYGTGTLILSLTKGLERYKVVISKMSVLTLLWTAGYWICFAITYAYNAYFWDNSIAQNILLSALCWWLFGVFVLSLMCLFSTLSSSNTTVILGMGGTVLVSYLLGLFPKIVKYLPTFLMDGTSLVYGATEAKSYVFAIVITAVLTAVCFVVSIFAFNKKQL